jgi:hypothetical protein
MATSTVPTTTATASARRTTDVLVASRNHSMMPYNLQGDGQKKSTANVNYVSAGDNPR